MSIFSSKKEEEKDTQLLEEEPEIKEEPSIFLDLLQTVVVALSVCVVIYLFIATPNEVHGESMEPNFHDKDLLLTNKMVQYLGTTKLEKLFHDYNHGDVVIFKPDLSNEDYIKRVIAVGGDTFMIKEGFIYLNDEKLDESYLSSGLRTNAGDFLTEGKSVRVPDGQYIVLGDNRGSSTDSRSNLVGFVERSQMKGRVVFRYWPLEAFGAIPKALFK